VCITGAGNAAHVFIPYFVNQGYDVTVFADFKDEAERLQKGVDENGGILIHDRCDPNRIREYKGIPKVISKNAADAIPQADYVIAALPSFAIKNVLNGIKPHLKNGATVYIMPGQGGADFIAKEVLGDECRAGKVTVAGIIPMPLNCRISDWGKRVELAALKDSYDLASVPAKNSAAAAEALSGLLAGRRVNAIGNYVGIALHASNPNIHPGRLYGLFSDYTEGKIYPENPLFYGTWDDKSSEWCQKNQ
jgi:opine dehydrogenase